MAVRVVIISIYINLNFLLNTHQGGALSILFNLKVRKLLLFFCRQSAFVGLTFRGHNLNF